MSFIPYLLYSQNISTTFIPTLRSLPRYSLHDNPKNWFTAYPRTRKLTWRSLLAVIIDMTLLLSIRVGDARTLAPRTTQQLAGSSDRSRWMAICAMLQWINLQRWIYNLQWMYIDGSQCETSVWSTFIRDCGSNLYVGMRVVEMFWQYNRQGRKDIITKLYVNKMDIYGKPWPSWVQICPLISAQLYRSRENELWKKSKIVIFFLSFFLSSFFFLLSSFFFSSGANSRTIRRTCTEKVPKCFSLSCEEWRLS